MGILILEENFQPPNYLSTKRNKNGNH